MRKFKLITALLIIYLVSTTAVHAQWNRKTDINMFAQGRWSAQSFTLDGKIYVGGGYVGSFSNYNDLQEYDPTADVWTTKNNMPGSNTSRTAGVAFVINGKAYLGLGVQDFNSFSPTPTYLTDLWEYDAINDTWTQKANFPDSGRGEVAVFVANKKAYLIGGTTGGNKYSNDTWEYNPATDQWTAKTPFPLHRIHKGLAVSINNKGYVTGGSAGYSQYNQSMYEYNAATDTWTQKTDFPANKGKYGGVAFEMGGKMYIGLGKDSLDYDNDFYIYDANNDTWSFLDNNFPGHERMWGVAQVVNGRAYVGLGWHYDNATTTQTLYRDWYEVNPTDLLRVNGVTNNANQIKMYPNPAKGQVYINTNSSNEGYTYSIYNQLGQVVLQGELTGKTINVSKLSIGSYIIKLNSNAAAITKRLIISE